MIPLPRLEQLARPVDESFLRGYLGEERAAALIPELRGACLLPDNRLFLDLQDHTETLPADPRAAARAAFPLLERESAARESEERISVAAEAA